MVENVITNIMELGFPWDTVDPFLFCVHHLDYYPKGNRNLGPDASLAGRDIGRDFTLRDGWRMYHGSTVPGFPVHPHRGFETVTIVRQGIVDHADSLGAAGRYGAGDVQWLTTGAGVQHSEMFPLLHQDRNNTLELFQIWLNLPAERKMAKPHFKMLWRDQIPRLSFNDANGKRIEIDVYAGTLGKSRAPSPPPESWAAEDANQVAIWLIKLDRHACWELPACGPGINRTLYFFAGESLTIAGQPLTAGQGARLVPEAAPALENGGKSALLLLLQGRPINEPVVQHGPFVMNTRSEILQAFQDYQETAFGGWPWPLAEQVHGATRGRFASHADGEEEERDE